MRMAVQGNLEEVVLLLLLMGGGVVVEEWCGEMVVA